MRTKKNRLAFIILLTLAGLIWNLYSYLCIGLIHKFDTQDLSNYTESISVLNIMWECVYASIICNGSILIISGLLYIFNKAEDVRQWNYRAILVMYAITTIIWEYNCRLLLNLSPGDSNIINGIIRSGYYTYVIVSIIIIFLLLSLGRKKNSRKTSIII